MIQLLLFANIISSLMTAEQMAYEHEVRLVQIACEIRYFEIVFGGVGSSELIYKEGLGEDY